MTRISFGPQTCAALDQSAAREWLVTDGLGGYAMGTVAGLRTRRYHGLLIVARNNGASRQVGLASLDPVFVVGDTRVRLATHEWAGGVIDPSGHELLARFDLIDGVPRWTWQVGGLVLQREIAMARGHPTVAISHRLLAADGPVRVELTPLCTWRDAHGERHGGAQPSVATSATGFVFEEAYRLESTGWQTGGEWYSGAYLRAEAERGLAAEEDLWAAGTFASTLTVGDSLDVVASAELSASLPPAGAIIDAARLRAGQLLAAAKAMDDSDELLVLAADQFIVNGGSAPSVIAGYPWFGGWSRDTMTSYEGLFLETGRAEEGRRLLLGAADTLSEGMLANTADTGTLEYNTVDGTLWFLHALGRHVAVTNDTDLIVAMDGQLEEILEYHVRGTRYGIRMDPADGLLRQGAEEIALTWMDARVDGVAVTGRTGKPVEVNGLWINALRTVSGLHSLLGRHSGRWDSVADTANRSFTARFVRRDGLGLFDVVDGAGDDRSIRPNQLLALSLPYGPGGPRSAVEVCRDRLLTPIGLRSLSDDDSQYIGHHRGGPHERDRAYHQGTVWPWLLGPYAEAARKSQVPTDHLFDAIDLHLHEWGLGSISETADGDAPHAAAGCPFQAWSVAEVLRARRLG